MTMALKKLHPLIEIPNESPVPCFELTLLCTGGWAHCARCPGDHPPRGRVSLGAVDTPAVCTHNFLEKHILSLN